MSHSGQDLTGPPTSLAQEPPDGSHESDDVSSAVERVIQILEENNDPNGLWAAVCPIVARALAIRGLGRSARGATPTQPDAPARRPFVGFDRESAAYARLKPELLETAEGKYVAFVGDEMVGPMGAYDDALRAGYLKFGRGPLFVKQVRTEEQKVEISRVVSPCPV